MQVSEDFLTLEHSVRFAQFPDNPNVISLYIFAGQQVNVKSSGRTSKFVLNLRIAKVLLETSCDQVLPEHWRRLCLDYIYRPLVAAQRNAHSERHICEIRHFRHELAVSQQISE